MLLPFSGFSVAPCHYPPAFLASMVYYLCMAWYEFVCVRVLHLHMAGGPNNLYARGSLEWHAIATLSGPM